MAPRITPIVKVPGGGPSRGGPHFKMKNYYLTFSEDMGLILHFHCKDGKAAGLNLGYVIADRLRLTICDWLEETISEWLEENEADGEIEQKEIL